MRNKTYRQLISIERFPLLSLATNLFTYYGLWLAKYVNNTLKVILPKSLRQNWMINQNLDINAECDTGKSLQNNYYIEDFLIEKEFIDFS